MAILRNTVLFCKLRNNEYNVNYTHFRNWYAAVFFSTVFRFEEWDKKGLSNFKNFREGIWKNSGWLYKSEKLVVFLVKITKIHSSLKPFEVIGPTWDGWKERFTRKTMNGINYYLDGIKSVTGNGFEEHWSINLKCYSIIFHSEIITIKQHSVSTWGST